MTLTRSRGLVGVGAVVVAVAVIGAALISGWTPALPADAALAPIAHTTLVGEVDSDPALDGELPNEPISPSGQQCLDRITRDAGFLDLCWQVVRAVDGDVHKDYYTLRLYGTASGSGGGLRWWALSADLVGEPGDQVFDGWPSGTFDGPCATQSVPAVVGVNESAYICGRTIGDYVTSATWAYRVTWACVGCLLPDHSAHEVVLYSSVGVPQGTIPTWSIGADFGS